MAAAASCAATAALRNRYEVASIPTAYETPIELPPGEYKLEVVLSDGTKFGRVQVPLTIDRYDGKQLALSSVVRCNR